MNDYVIIDDPIRECANVETELQREKWYADFIEARVLLNSVSIPRKNGMGYNVETGEMLTTAVACRHRGGLRLTPDKLL